MSDRTLDDARELGQGPPKQIMRRGATLLWRGLSEQPRLFALAILGSAVYGVLTVADAWVLGWATDNVIAPSFARGDVVQGTLWIAIALFLAVAVIRAIGVIARRLIGGMAYYRLVAGHRRRVTRKYLELPLSWHHRHPTGQLLSNANADVEAAWTMMLPLPMALGVLIMMVAAIIAMALADPVLTLVGLVIFPALFLINVFYQRWSAPKVAQAQALRGELSALAHESFDGAQVIKSLGRERDETERFTQASQKVRDASIEVGRVRSFFDPLLEALPDLGVLLVIVVGIGRVGSGAADPGDVVQVAYLFTIVAFPVRAIGWVLAELPRSAVGWDRVSSVLGTEEQMEYGTQDLPGEGPVELRLRDVWHAFDRVPVLAGIDLQIKAGTVTALVGATGSGKSVLTTLLSRLVDPDRGGVQLDGVDIASLSHASLAETVAVVPQSTFLFDDSVRENITLGLDVPNKQIWRVLRSVMADGFVANLPRGLETELGERGTTLSGGQRQRIALARALVRSPRLLVLDDATSALDPQIEQQILWALAESAESAEGPTVLLVAYRKATIALADQVALLESGTISAVGSHSELLANSSEYADLVNAYERRSRS